MNALDILKYGNTTLLDTLEDLSDEEWDTIGATSQWTPKDVLAHLLASELILVDALTSVQDPDAALPTLKEIQEVGEEWEDQQRTKRQDVPRGVVMKEYEDAHKKSLELAEKLGPEKLREVGTIPWYGEQYALDDYIVYAIYAHKREHSGMIRLWLKNLRKR